MSPEQHQALVDQFDQRKGETPVEGPSPAGADTRQEWELLELAVEAIQLHAITEQVRRTRMQFEQEQRELERGQVENESSELPVGASVPVGKLADLVEAGRPSAASPATVRDI